MNNPLLRRFIVATFLLLPLCGVLAQNESTGVVRRLAERGYALTLSAGYNIGGTLPLPLPAEIRSVNSYSPGLRFSVGAEIERMFTDKWGVMTGLRFESKGMESGVTVENYHTRLTRDGDQMEGNYTGEESTKVSYTLMSVPVLARYRLGAQWAVSVGVYAAYAIDMEFAGEAANGYMRTLMPDPVTGEMVPIGNKVEIPKDKPATYDFSDDMRRFQWGVELGVDWQCLKHFKVFAHVDWGLNDTFKSDFEETIAFAMYPVYATVGFGYRF